MAIENNGFIYVVSGYRIFKVDPTNGKVVKTLKLPTPGLHAQQLPRQHRPSMTRPRPRTRSTPRTTVSTRSRTGRSWSSRCTEVAGCTLNGPSAVPQSATNPGDVPRSVLISVNPNTMRIIQNVPLPAPAPARPTITRYHGVDYVYLLENTSNAGALLSAPRDLHPGQ